MLCSKTPKTRSDDGADLLLCREDFLPRLSAFLSVGIFQWSLGEPAHDSTLPKGGLGGLMALLKWKKRPKKIRRSIYS
jgi:hypothetical protein